MCQRNAGECRGIPEEHMGGDETYQGNAGECQGNVWKWVQSARRIQVNARGMYGSVRKVTGMEGNAG